MRVLVTNDDGVASAGLHELAAALVAAGHDVTVAAPDRDMSGSGAAIGQIHVDEEIEATPIELDGLEGVPAYAVDGPPGLCVLASRLGGFGEPPELVVSGINPGCNAGRAILHSGTVGAALTGANFGGRGLAISLDVSSRKLHEAATAGARDAVAHWATAATVGAALAGWVQSAPECTVLNVNVPNVPLGELAGIRRAELAPFGTVRSSVVETTPGGGRLQMELRPTTEEMPPDSDTGLVARRFVAVTPIVGPRAADLDVSGALATFDRLAVDARSTA